MTKDDEGQVCIQCSHVGLGAREVLPELVSVQGCMTILIPNHVSSSRV